MNTKTVISAITGAFMLAGCATTTVGEKPMLNTPTLDGKEQASCSASDDYMKAQNAISQMARFITL